MHFQILLHGVKFLLKQYHTMTFNANNSLNLIARNATLMFFYAMTLLHDPKDLRSLLTTLESLFIAPGWDWEKQAPFNYLERDVLRYIYDFAK